MLPLHRFAEYPDIKVFSVNPGSVETDMFNEFDGPIPPDSTSTVELAAATILHLTSGQADYLSGPNLNVGNRSARHWEI